MKIIESNNDTQSIGFRELREQADKVISKVAKGQSFVVKRKSKALFRIVPLEEEVWNTVVDFTEVDKDGISPEDILEAIDELKKDQPAKYGRQDKKISR